MCKLYQNLSLVSTVLWHFKLATLTNHRWTIRTRWGGKGNSCTDEELYGNWPNCRNCIEKCPIQEDITKWFLTQYWPALICLFVSVSALCVCGYVRMLRYSPQSNNIKVCVRLLWKWPQNAFGNSPCDALRHLSHKCAVRVHTHTYVHVFVYIYWMFSYWSNTQSTYTHPHTDTVRI